MNWLDIALLIFLLVGFWKGYLNGFFVELTSLVALVAAIYGSIHFSNYAGDWLMSHTEWDDSTITIVSFIITFVVIILVVTYVGKLVTKLVKTVQLSFLNKIAGGAFGLVKLAFIASVILMFVNSAAGEIQIIDREVKEESLVYPYVEPVAPYLLPKILEQADELDRKIRGEEKEWRTQRDTVQPDTIY
ncbi:CvpA family protein [Nonlabens agnitus]|uniref:Colicin V production protein n=1 Tax=Nonlabens agnitus TaxID=870484 RepID=A0A2S9WWM0_9FLAO|nr:CvpA family protein [Nonlabens agnitus]PRP67831.1 colicin V production protein [Nonlabens agnitus]